MKLLCYDNIIFSLQRIGGISVYWYELTRRTPENIEVIHIDHQGAENNILFRKKSTERRRQEISLPLFMKRFLPFCGRLPAGSIFHSSYQRVSLQRKVVNITTVHDCGYELGTMRQGWKRWVHLVFKRLALRRSDGIIAISNNTKEDLLRLYPQLKPEIIKVIYNGVSEEFFVKERSKRPSYLPDKYVLFVGIRDRYKNFVPVVEKLSRMSEYHLLVAGGRALTTKELALLEELLPGRYTFLLSPTNDVLCDLYNYAYCLLYPSSYEGFGIPIAEAMRCGCPVIALRCSSIPEVAGDAALLLEVDELEKIPDAIRSLEDPEVRIRYIERGKVQAAHFSWEKCASETFAFYDEVYQRKLGKLFKS